MAAAETLSLLDIQAVLDTWAAAGGPTDEEKIEFAEGALHELRNDPNQQFQENVMQVGVWANQVDATFNAVNLGFEKMVIQYFSQFPYLIIFLITWRGYMMRWDGYLRDSRVVASEHVTILRRFDQVYLEKVEQIQTNQDRLNVIAELQQFIDEDHSNSTRLSENFLALKRDIEHFVVVFDQWVIDQGVALDNQAKALQAQLVQLLREIESLDKQIRDASIALAVSGGLLNIIGLIVAGSLLATYRRRRAEKAGELHRKQLELANANQRQVALAHLKTEFDIFKPDIALMCENLVSLAEIWSSVRSQCVQFQSHLKGGTGAETNMRFKLEVRLAREVCLPLMEGLRKYSAKLENRGIRHDSVQVE